MEFAAVILLLIFVLFFTDIGLIFSIGGEDKSVRNKEDEKYSFKKLNERLNKK